MYHLCSKEQLTFDQSDARQHSRMRCQRRPPPEEAMIGAKSNRLVSYKKVPTNALMSAIQLGIANSIGSLASRPDRDLLLQDFEKIENVAFPA
ncbi:hypothetical protein ANCDUO_08444 [Ancylostoma duodenale]|uniref:Uncharacterized protein n=1 Tax=Ancylostoma duodenale TaxID=51022 RepID=A0A0C2GJA9_9BILA|nr:hypothetical protein ANCDUO_08444 [Ancylostoma duodenale]